MLLMKVRKIKRDGRDFALSVPLSILPGLNADFDGDILNIIGMVDKSIAHMFRRILWTYKTSLIAGKLLLGH